MARLERKRSPSDSDHRLSSSSSLIDRSVNTKPCSSTAVQPDNPRSDDGSAPMKENAAHVTDVATVDTGELDGRQRVIAVEIDDRGVGARLKNAVVSFDGVDEVADMVAFRSGPRMTTVTGLPESARNTAAWPAEFQLPETTGCRARSRA